MKKILIIAILLGAVTNNFSYSSSLEIARNAACAAGVSGTLAAYALDAIEPAQILRGVARGATGVGAAVLTTQVIPALALPTGYAIHAIEQVWKNPGVAKAVRNEVTVLGALTTIPFICTLIADYKLVKYALLG